MAPVARLARAVEKVVVATAAARPRPRPARRELTRERTTVQRWHAVHDLLDNGVGLLDCSPRLGLALNTIKRYARVPEPDRLRRPPQYRACQVDPYRNHLRRRRHEEPGVAVMGLFDEIKTWATPAASTCSTSTSTRAARRASASCHRRGA